MSILRSLLFLPGNNPGMLQNGGVFGADGVILDLEDAVSPTEKNAARHLVSHALQSVDYKQSKKIIRINPLDNNAQADIATIVACQPDVLMLPKVNRAEDIAVFVELITQQEHQYGLSKTIQLIPLLETPLGIMNAYTIATASERIIALALGAEDYTAALGALRSSSGEEILLARTAVINAAAAAGIDAIDTPFTDTLNEDGLRQDVLFARQLGFKGKLAINPRQVNVIHDGFNPTTDEIYWAKRVINVLKEAKASGAGVIALDGKMIDAPIVVRAERILMLTAMFHLDQEPTR